MPAREDFSNMKFYQAIVPNVYNTTTMPAAGVVNGPCIDTQGYETLTFIIGAGDVDVSQATSLAVVRMQHTDASALGLGPSTYADVSMDDILAIPSALDCSTGAALTSGIILAFSVSGTSVANFESQVWKFGYKGDKRYVRLVVESHGTADIGSVYIGAEAILGAAYNWPTTEYA
jgi:hypothetical protein